MKELVPPRLVTLVRRRELTRPFIIRPNDARLFAFVVAAVIVTFKTKIRLRKNVVL